MSPLIELDCEFFWDVRLCSLQVHLHHNEACESAVGIHALGQLVRVTLAYFAVYA